MVDFELLQVICGESQTINLGDVVKVIQPLPHKEGKLIRNIVFIIRIVLANATTSATPQRLFSTLRWLKAWLCSTVTQKRFNSISLVHKNQANIDEISLIDVENQYANLHFACLNIFGKFTGKDI